MIPTFPNQRRLHCETGVLVNLLEYYGYNISEPMAFGIGGGMYFLYFPWMKLMGFVLPETHQYSASFCSKDAFGLPRKIVR